MIDYNSSTVRTVQKQWLAVGDDIGLLFLLLLYGRNNISSIAIDVFFIYVMVGIWIIIDILILCCFTVITFSEKLFTV